eukprot:4466500-Prymnesium_polylepis.1
MEGLPCPPAGCDDRRQADGHSRAGVQDAQRGRTASGKVHGGAVRDPDRGKANRGGDSLQRQRAADR